MAKQSMTARRMVRLRPVHDEILESIANRRGCDVSDLFREAIIEHFNLPTEANQTFVEQVDNDMAVALAAVPAGGEASEVSQ